MTQERFMKAGRLLLLVLFHGTLAAQSRWSDPVTLKAKAVSPDLDIDSRNGDLHIVTIGGTDYDTRGVTYFRLDSLGTILTSETVPGSESAAGGWCFGPGVSVDADGDPHVVYPLQVDRILFNTYLIERRPAGWGESQTVSFIQNRGFMIRIAAVGPDRLHMARGQDLDVSPWAAATYVRSSGGSFDRQIAGLNSYRTDDRIEIGATADGKVHVILGCPNPGGSPVSYYRSDDGGETLSFIADVHSSQNTGRNGSPDLFVDASGTAHICYGSQIDVEAGSAPSVRYVRYEGGNQVRNVMATSAGALETYNEGNGWGIGSVAATSDGRVVGIAYLTRAAGDLYFTLSWDAGATWSTPELIASGVGSADGRNKHVLRAVRNHFALVYPQGQDIRVRLLRNVGDNPPTASAGGPYTLVEGQSVTFNGSGSADTGQNAGIVSYAWDFNNDGVWDSISGSPTVERTYDDNTTAIVRLRVTDRSGFTAEATSTLTVTNAAPSVDVGADRTGLEGGSFNFEAVIRDPGRDSHTVLWNFRDGKTGQGPAVSHVFVDDGVFMVLARVTDDDGAVGADSARVTIANVAPSVEAGGPYTGTTGSSVQFHGSASDPGKNDVLTFEWDLDGDGIFETRGITSPTFVYQVFGRIRAAFRVSDNDGGVGSDTASVTIMLDKPTIAGIPDQTTDEGNAFAPIHLDALVSDPVHGDAELTWRFRGDQRLAVTLSERVLQARPVDPEWSGSEDIWIYVLDPLNHADSSRVRFIVRPVNDAPVWTRANPDIVMPEDSSAVVLLDSLRARINDLDNDVSAMTFSVSGNRHIRWSVDAAKTRITLATQAAGWYGIETLLFVATDPLGASCRDSVTVTVLSVLDPPAPFKIVEPAFLQADAWPDTIVFRWRASSTQDSIGVVYYAWNLHQQGALANPVRRVVTYDTLFRYAPDMFLPEGIFFWDIDAVDQYGISRTSSNLGILHIGTSGVRSPGPAPERIALAQNYPNPFNPCTAVTFELPAPTMVRLVVYNAAGQSVAVLREGKQPQGTQTVEWNGRDDEGRKLPSGVYVCRLEAGGMVLNRKMILMQ
jgi:PKD repeat protein